MELVITRKLYDGYGEKAWKPFGLAMFGYSSAAKLNISRWTLARVEQLEKMLQTKENLYGAKALLRDIGIWKKALADAGGTRARTLPAFRSLVIAYLGEFPGPRNYMREGDDGPWLAYYVESVTYHPPERHNYSTTPARVEIDTVHEKHGKQRKSEVVFHIADITGRNVVQALAEMGVHAETDEFREQYLAEKEKFEKLYERIGTQCLATGRGVQDLDETRSSWQWRSVKDVKMVREGAPSRVVVDVFSESDKEEDATKNKVTVDPMYWRRMSQRDTDKESEQDDDGDEVEVTPEDDEEIPTVEIPMHPYVACFDLKRHMRFSIHVTNLTEYVYDPLLAEKLVLPEEEKKLVTMLVEHKDAGFKDIVGGKSGGAVVLLGGPPGTGKTLTAEVYAESEKRALYSVQCSQLGTDADTLESSLMTVFARAKRWDAVLLLDEADVYVHERGNDMQQNAIVGVFLRVLEYQSSVMFLTTNRPQDVDDAVASRCLARLTYRIPDKDAQRRIWQVLSASSKVKLDPSYERFVQKHAGLSGRDVKNLLKLAMLVGKGEPITYEVLAYVKKFQPTEAVRDHDHEPALNR